MNLCWTWCLVVVLKASSALSNEVLASLPRTFHRTTDGGYFFQYTSDEDVFRLERGSIVGGYLEVKGAIVIPNGDNHFVVYHYTGDTQGFRIKDVMTHDLTRELLRVAGYQGIPPKSKLRISHKTLASLAGG